MPDLDWNEPGKHGVHCAEPLEAYVPGGPGQKDDPRASGVSHRNEGRLAPTDDPRRHRGVDAARPDRTRARTTHDEARIGCVGRSASSRGRLRHVGHARFDVDVGRRERRRLFQSKFDVPVLDVANQVRLEAAQDGVQHGVEVLARGRGVGRRDGERDPDLGAGVTCCRCWADPRHGKPVVDARAAVADGFVDHDGKGAARRVVEVAHSNAAQPSRRVVRNRRPQPLRRVVGIQSATQPPPRLVGA